MSLHRCAEDDSLDPGLRAAFAPVGRHVRWGFGLRESCGPTVGFGQGVLLREEPSERDPST